MSSAVCAFPRAEVRTSAGRRSVPGMRSGTSISAVIARLGSSVSESGDRVVTTGDLTQGTTGGVGSARVQEARLAGIWRTSMRLHAGGCSSSPSPSSKNDAASVPQKGRGQVLHGVFGSSEHVAPQKFTL